MTDYQIVPASPLHVGPLIARLGSQADRAALIGWRPRALARWYLANSCEAYTALFGGHPLAMWGVLGASLATDAVPWLCLSDEIRDRRFAIVREARRFLAHFLETRSSLTTPLEPDQACSVRFARFLGFEMVEGATIEVPGMTYLVARMTR